jgi:hypothetical protein
MPSHNRKLAAVLATAVATLSLLGAKTRREPAGEITALLPSVSIQRGPSIDPAKKSDPIFLHDLVRTSPGGRVRIRLADQSVISLGTDSEIRIQQVNAKSQRTNIQIVYGLIRMQIQHMTSDAGRFELKTPVAVAGVIGTDFGADSSDPNVTRFVCIGGTVEIRNADPSVKGTVLCEGGHTTQVRSGQPPDQPIAITPEQTERWQHITDPDSK